MGEKEDKEKAEKLAAAKKRVAQLQKKKKAAAEKSGTKDKSSKDDTPKSPTKGESAQVETEDAAETTEQSIEEAQDAQGTGEQSAAADVDPDEALFNDAIKTATTTTTAEDVDDADTDAAPSFPGDLTNPKTRKQHGRQPSMSIQSKLRSTSFRTTPGNGQLSPSLPVLSPDGETAPDIYRKQALRLEELEKENKRLAKEVEEGNVRWRRSEEELEVVREREAERQSSGATVAPGEEVERLRAEIATLRKRSGSISKAARSGSVPDVSPEQLALTRKELETKDSTISDMALEISKLRTQISSQMDGCETHGAQISALQSSLDTAEGKLRAVSGELADTRKAIERASERAVREGTEKTSAATKVRSLEREIEALKAVNSDAVKKKEGLEKKVEVMGRVQRESEERWNKRMEGAEKENKRLRDEKVKRMGKGGDGVEGDDGGMEELEDEERSRLEGRVRELEGEIFELRRGVWRERRGMSNAGEAGLGQPDRPSFEVEGFDEVDLSGNTSGKASRRRSFANPLLQQKHSGFSQVLTSGLAAFRGTPTPDYSHQQNRPRNDSLLQDFDDDDTAGFDEAAFAQAQREEEARKMVEHVREVKRGLKNWAGWRLDLTEVRRGMGSGGDGGGAWFGEIFDI